MDGALWRVLLVLPVHAVLVLSCASECFSVVHARACAGARGDEWLCVYVAQHFIDANQRACQLFVGRPSSRLTYHCSLTPEM